MVPTDEQTFKPVDLNLSDIKAAIPSHLFDRDTARGFRYLARDILQAVVLAIAIYKADDFLNGSLKLFAEHVYVRIALSYLAWSS